jgi:TonB-dependent SusC/RagA subfamily outer membrane receptor
MKLLPLRTPSVLACGLLSASLCGCVNTNGAAFSPPKAISDPSVGTVVTSSDIDGTANDPIRSLAAHVSGVMISGTPDGGIAVRIRGASSIMASTAPLYVIDGLPIEAGPDGALSGINPRDIASIQVLKDAASTAFYGVRGANGVIVIKTKIAH